MDKNSKHLKKPESTRAHELTQRVRRDLERAFAQAFSAQAAQEPKAKKKLVRAA